MTDLATGPVADPATEPGAGDGDAPAPATPQAGAGDTPEPGAGARALLPDYARLLATGSHRLGAGPATGFGAALDLLLDAYRALPQRPGTALALGRLDVLLTPYRSEPEPQQTVLLTRFWETLAELPGPAYATIGPRTGPLSRALLRIAADTGRTGPAARRPRLVLRTDPTLGTDPLLDEALATGQGHGVLLADDRVRPPGIGDDHAVIDGGVRLPVGGGAFGLIRFDLVSSVLQHRAGPEEYLAATLPEQVRLFAGVLAARTARAAADPTTLGLDWTGREGLVDPGRFGAVFAVTGLAEAAAKLSGGSPDPGLTARIRTRLTDLIAAVPMPHCRLGDGRAWLYLPSGRPAVAEGGAEDAVSGAAELVAVRPDPALPPQARGERAVHAVREALLSGASLCVAADRHGTRRVTGFFARERVGTTDDLGPADGGYVAGTVQRSQVDGPGERLVVFLQGCTFDCLNCHNPCSIPIAPPGMVRTGVTDLVESIAAGAAAGGTPGTEDAPDGRDGPEAGGAAGNPRDGGAGQVPVTGVTVSGGEATVQAPFVRALFAALADDPRTAGLTRFVDSNGDCDPQVWEMLAPVTDGVMLDLKALDEDRHIVLTGESNARSLASIRTVAALGLLHEVRLLLVPGLNDDDDTLRRTAAWLHGAAPGVRVVINAFRHEGTRACARDLVEPRPADLTRYREVLTGAGLTDLTVPSP